MGKSSNPMKLPKKCSVPGDESGTRRIACSVSSGIRAEWKCPGDAIRNITSNSLSSEIISSGVGSIDHAQPNWEETILKPLLEAYPRIDNGATFATYTVAAVLVAYEIICQRNAVLTQDDYDLVESMFSRFLYHENVLLAIREAVEAEIEEASGSDLNPSKLNTLFVLDALLAEASIRLGQKAKSAAAFNDMADGATLTPSSPTSTIAVQSTHAQTASSRDVEIQYYLHKECALVIDRVTSTDLRGETLVLGTSDGRRVEIEEGVTVSSIAGACHTVEIRAPNTDGFELSATVVLPPGKSYIVEEAISSGRAAENQELSFIETGKATIYIADGPYAVVLHNGGQVEVRNVFQV
ncbi:hypothetical protein BU23DRAFT_641506 [Bimuria novae-zelandiae CBS 107.79]|uniref:Uncharacterized protein n=1 Tax=Bimuria novae-zelandiae CBS 107.79 TaxID=1447943 RepID=A0A6A5VDG8_9PLEO|nr:hypothetical protein BU23DRAFT_641506 [Bimuria novae-zelandiae CBS 107.79]